MIERKNCTKCPSNSLYLSANAHNPPRNNPNVSFDESNPLQSNPNLDQSSCILGPWFNDVSDSYGWDFSGDGLDFSDDYYYSSDQELFNPESHFDEELPVEVPQENLFTLNFSKNSNPLNDFPYQDPQGTSANPENSKKSFYKNFFDNAHYQEFPAPGNPSLILYRKKDNKKNLEISEMQFKYQLANYFLKGFNGKNILPKKLVILLLRFIHEHYLKDIPKIGREEERVARKLYKKFLPYADQIFQCITEHKAELSLLINLDKIKKKKKRKTKNKLSNKK